MWFNSLRSRVSSFPGKSPATRAARRAPGAKNSRRRACLMSIEQLEVRTVPSTTLTVYSLSGSAAYSLGDGSLRGGLVRVPAPATPSSSIPSGGRRASISPAAS